MSSFDTMRRGLAAGLGLAVMAAALLGAGCTAGPLYGNAGSPTSVPSRLASIEIEDVSTRQAQEVRNHLIFMFGGGRGSPANPAYVMRISVSASSSAAAQIVVSATEQSPSSSLLTMTTTYAVRDAESGKIVAEGSRSVVSAYDVPRQHFAAERAYRDAEDRAAREVAELVRLAVAQQLQLNR